MKLHSPLSISLTFSMGLFLGWLTGHHLLFLPITAISLFLLRWVRQQRATERRQAQQLVLFRALAEQSIRAGEVRACPGCKRPMQASAQRCIYCGLYRGDGPLR
jgi:hypothetical protein